MYAYVARRLLPAVPILITASILVFALVDLSGDPNAALVSRLQQAAPGGTVAQAAVDAERERLYLDRSMPERYWLWLTGIGGHGDIGLLQGKWGPSVRAEDHDIGGEFGMRITGTLRLVLVAVLLIIGLAMLTGVVGAVHRHRVTDRVLTGVGLLALALPVFWLAVLLKETGAARVGDLAPPALALVLTGYAAVGRHQRSATLDVLDGDYIRLARAKGLRARVVMRRHALRTAVLPLASSAPLVLTGVLGGVVIVEFVFGRRGLGTYLLESIAGGDFHAVMGWLLLAGSLVVAANLAADLLCAALDPRIRYG